MKKVQTKFIIGVDEVGRGPLAGPVAVGALCATTRMLKKFRLIKESKQLSPLQREAWYARILLARGEELHFAVSFVSAAIIDRKGITFAIRLALARSLLKLETDVQRTALKNSPKGRPLYEESMVLLDGGLKAPATYIHQQTIIHGDAQELSIAMASVVAKVLRDRRMVRLHKKYPEYGFAAHKGYGTKAHYRALAKRGLSPVHRRSFL